MDERPRWRDVAEATLNGSGARVRMRACARVPRFRVDARFLPRPAKLARLMVWGGTGRCEIVVDASGFARFRGARTVGI